MCSKGHPFFIIFSILLGFNILSGCSEKSASERKKYSIYVMAKDGKEYIYQVDSLSKGAINPIKNGAQVFPKQIWYDLIVKNGFYYRLDRKSNYFIKSTVKDSRFQPLDSVFLKDFTFIDNYNWTHPDTLFIVSFNNKTGKLQSAKVNPETLKAEIQTFPLPLPSGRYNAMSVGFTYFDKAKLFAGYTYHSISAAQQYKTSDTAYVAVLRYPELKLEKILKDTRSTYPGGNNTAQPNTFSDEQGDFYFLACPGIAMGNHPNLPTAIYRIQKDQEVLDSTFFFNISTSSIENHGYGLWYIGNHQAIIRSERRTLFTGIEDHYKVPHVEFHLLDLNTKTTKKLDLPLDKGTSRQCVLVENGLVYISLNSDADGNFIWVYNPQDSSLKKGLSLQGDIDYILRIEKLYED